MVNREQTPMNKLTAFLKSEQGQNIKLILDTVISVLTLLWLMKMHKYIKK
jgi:hypothetical protein